MASAHNHKTSADEPKTAVKRSKRTNFPISGGLTREDTLGLESDKANVAELQLRVLLYEQMLMENTQAIAYIGWILNKSQPPIKGKIELRWWKPRGDALHQPRIIMYSDRPGFPETIKIKGLPKRASKRGGFKKNFKDTVSLLTYLQQLLDSRKLLMKYCSDFKRLITRYENANHKNLINAKNFGGIGVLGMIEWRIDERASKVE